MLKLRPKHALIVAVAGVNLVAVSAPMLVHADTQTTTTVVGLTINPVLLSYTSGPTVTLGAITPTSGGLQSATSDTVSGNTNDASGFTVTMQENSSSSTAMLSGANTLPTSAGTTASPVALVSDTWGWRIDGTAGFGAGPTSLISNAAPSALTYAAIPANGSPYTIKTTGSSGSGSQTVWYSARVDTSQVAGAYATTVLYTFTTN
jgi:hypothetical protein